MQLPIGGGGEAPAALSLSLSLSLASFYANQLRTVPLMENLKKELC